MGVKYYRPLALYALYPLRREDPGRHASDCPLGYPPGSRADLRVAAAGPPAVVEREGVLVIEPAWPLSEGASRPRLGAEVSPGPDHAGGLRRGAGQASLLTMLEVLWRTAGLHYWQPGFAGERDYGLVSHRLRQAMHRVRLRGMAVREWVYCPPPYHPGQQAELLTERAAWWARLAPMPDGHAPSGYWLGLWRAVEDVGNGWVVLRLRHCPLRGMLSAAAWREQAARWGVAPDRVPSWPVVWLLRVCRARETGPDQVWIRDLAALHLADETCWVPVASAPERALVQALVAQRRIFVKPLAAAGVGWPSGEPMPDVVLLDRRDRCALEVVGRLADRAYAVRWRQKEAQYRETGRAYWAWRVEEQSSCPPLPPPDRR